MHWGRRAAALALVAGTVLLPLGQVSGQPTEGAAELAAPPPGVVDRELLALCRSEDRRARWHCFREIEWAGDTTPEVRAALARLSARDAELHTRAQRAYRALFAEEPPPYLGLEEARRRRRPRAAPEPRIPPGDPYRVVYAPTAWVRPPGTGSLNGFELGTIQVDYGLHDNLQLGFQTMLPIGVLGLGAIARAGFSFDGGAVGITANGIALIPMAEGGRPLLLFGAGPTLTLGSPEGYGNGGVLVYGITDQRDEVTVIIPHAGGSLVVTPHLRVNAELYSVSVPEEGVDFGELFALLAGVRIFGESVWGDIALLFPICEGCHDLYEVLPLGIPFLSVGASW